LNLLEILPELKKLLQKLSFQNFVENENIGERSICNFSTNIFGGRK